MSLIINTPQMENKNATIVGDFNINLLQINEIENFYELFDPMCTKITLPNRSSKRSCALIDQMFCKSLHLDHVNISSAIIISNISDHFSSVANLEILKDKPKRPKCIQKRIISKAATHTFREELRSSDISSQLSLNLMTDPKPEYDIFERITVTAYENTSSPINAWKWTNINITYLRGSQYITGWKQIEELTMGISSNVSGLQKENTTSTSLLNIQMT